MSDNPVIAKLAGLLRSDSVEIQAAAAVVARELRLRDRAVVESLLALLGSDINPVKRAAIEALSGVNSQKVLSELLPLVGSSNEDVRKAAGDALAAGGETAVALLRQRLSGAPPWEKRVLEETLARMGGKDALSAMLASLSPHDLDAARAAVMPLRARVLAAADKERRDYVNQATRFLSGKAAAVSPAAAIAAIKVIGFGEDPVSIPVLLEFGESKKNAVPAREEALIALRLCLKSERQKSTDKERVRVTDRLVAAAEKAPLPVARVALLSLAGLPVSTAATRRLGALAGHAEAERGVLAIGFLGGVDGADATQALAAALNHAPDRARAEAAAQAVSQRPDAPAALARALLAAPDADRANLLSGLLRSHARKLERPVVKRLLDTAAGLLLSGSGDALPYLQITRVADATGTTAILRTVIDKLKRGKNPDRTLSLLRLLAANADATADDAYALAGFEFVHGRKDDALDLLARLSGSGFDVAKALLHDRSLDHEQRYRVGFHFAERRHALAEEILSGVADAAGRTKIGKMAKAKLTLSGLAGD